MADEWDESDDQAALMEAGLHNSRLKIFTGPGGWMTIAAAEELVATLQANIAEAYRLAKREPLDPDGN